ncbi:protein split ends-like isoform X1 [Scylla paramamosain]|uniref:protein split ends-like isoform X1 n=1 Tax=Scylla paramamosain TaxID=85552 RepID=UPI00308344E8
MSSSGGDDFFDDTESESEGKEDRGQEGNAVRERSPSDSASTEESFSEDEFAKQPKQDTDIQKSEEDCDDDNDTDVEDNDGDHVSESVHEESQDDGDEGSGRDASGGDERLVNNDRSEELERLFDTSPADVTSTSTSLKPSGARSTSAQCRVKVVVESAPVYSSSQTDLTGTRVKDQSNVSQETGGKDDHPPPLLVVRSSVHSRPPRKLGSRGSSPSSPRSPGTPPTTDSRGINRILTKKESAIAGRGAMGTGGAPKGPLLSMPPGREQPRQRPLGKYTRSLKMLGVKVPPAVPPAQRAGRSSSSQSWNSGRKLHTRLTRRSTSLEDVTRAIPQVKTPEVLHTLHVDEGQRATLSQAVYEEWYFARRQQINARKVKDREQIRKEEEMKEMEKKLKESKVIAAVSEWEKNKLEQMKNIKEKVRRDANKKMEEEKAKNEKNMQVSATIIAWETEKRELDAKKKEKMRLEKEAKREAEKQKQASKEEAEMVYRMWKQRKITQLRERQIKDKQRKDELAFKKEEEERRKREDADLAFYAWKRNKLQDERETTRKAMYVKAIEASVQSLSAAKKQEERSREALQAYEAWLDHVEEREPIRLYEEARASAVVKGRPPWWPGGSSNSLMGC